MSPEDFMDRAIALARRGEGRTAPNPCVGAVLVRDGAIVAEGWHTAWGRPHAEVEALADARRKNVNPADCTLFVTLEPCNHRGKTPPCTQAILDVGIREVAMGCADPNPEVTGGGADFLRARGVTVRMGVRERECRDLIADFRIWQTTDRPFSIVKLATTLDGRIAARTGQTAWISGEASRREVHRLRSWCGAVMVGGETFRTDNPRLTCRLPGYEGPEPLAVVVTRRLPETPRDHILLAEGAERAIFWTSPDQARSGRATRLKELGAAVWGLPEGGHGLDLAEGMRRLRRDRNCHYILAEGGGRLAASLRIQGLMDELRIFQAMKILGDEEGRPVFAGRGAISMEECWNFRLVEQSFHGTDLYLRLHPEE